MEKYKEIIKNLEKEKKKDIKENHWCEIFNYKEIYKDKNYDELRDLTRSAYNRIAKKLKRQLSKDFKYDVIIDKDENGKIYSRTRFVERLTLEEKEKLYDNIVKYINQNIKRDSDYIRYNVNPYQELEELLKSKNKRREVQYDIMEIVKSTINKTKSQFANVTRYISVYLFVIDYINDYYLENGKTPKDKFLKIEM